VLAFGRDDVELAVRHQQHVVLGLAEDDPLPVRGELREEVAHPVVRGALDRLGRPPAAVVPRNPVEIELEGLLVLDELGDVVLVEEDALGVLDSTPAIGLRPREDDPLTVGAPGGIALDVLGVVRARQRRVGARHGVVDDEDPLDREEELGELDPGRRHEHRAVLDRADHVAAVGRDLGEESEGELAVVLPVVAPGDDLLVVHHHLPGDREDGIAALVVAVVDVQAEDPAVAREGVAISADRQILEDYGRRGLGVDRAEAPADARRVLDGVEERERNLAVEDRVAHRVRGRPYANARRGEGLRLRPDPDDRDLPVALLGSLLDVGPVLLRGAPARLRRRKPEHLLRRAQPQQNHPALHAVGRVAPDEGRSDDLRRKHRFIEGIGDLELAGRLARKIQRRRRGIRSAGADGQQRAEQEPGPAGGRAREGVPAGSGCVLRVHRFGDSSRLEWLE
jgi:hypothetical protein